MVNMDTKKLQNQITSYLIYCRLFEHQVVNTLKYKCNHNTSESFIFNQRKFRYFLGLTVDSFIVHGHRILLRFSKALKYVELESIIHY